MDSLSQDKFKYFIIGGIIGFTLAIIAFLPLYFQTKKELISLRQTQNQESLQDQKIKLTQKGPIKKLYDLNFLETGFNMGGFIADPGDKIIFKIKNLNKKEHNLVIPDLGVKIETILPNEEKEIEFDLPKPPQEIKKEYQFFSDLHEGDKEKYSGKIIMNY